MFDLASVLSEKKMNKARRNFIKKSTKKPLLLQKK